MLTPQAIKDQEFQTKFRGYDSVEVKAYLELLAEDFFELTEQNRVQEEELESLTVEHESLQKEKENLVAEVTIGQENVDTIQAEIQEGYKQKDKELSDLNAKLETMEKMVAGLEEAKRDYLEQITELEEQLTGDQGSSKEDQAENEKMRAKLALLEEQNKELKKEGVDFKTTIVAAQKFADNLRQTSEEEAQKMMDEARADVENFRTEAQNELARLPKEIEELNMKKREVREELRTTLHSYLEALDVFSDLDGAERDEEISDLFQSIQIPEGENIDPDDIEKMDMDVS